MHVGSKRMAAAYDGRLVSQVFIAALPMSVVKQQTVMAILVDSLD